VLDNLRSAYNVGSIYRTADTARVAEVITCGYTPHPPHPKLAKTGFGALESVRT
jgi:23S rRNA (guanosine2251-2'-O)-methyltransferase